MMPPATCAEATHRAYGNRQVDVVLSDRSREDDPAAGLATSIVGRHLINMALVALERLGSAKRLERLQRAVSNDLTLLGGETHSRHGQILPKCSVRVA
jgi:hypothetical protein